MYLFIINGVGLLIFIAVCKVQEQIYIKKGPRYEPPFSVYIISSSSMKPAYRVYDLVINKRVDDIDTIKKGDIITFISTNLDYPGITITHRVKEIDRDEKDRICFITKGDANSFEDQACAKAHNVIGKVVFKVPFVGFLGTPYGVLFFLLVVISSLFLKKVRKINKSNKV